MLAFANQFLFAIELFQEVRGVVVIALEKCAAFRVRNLSMLADVGEDFICGVSGGPNA